MAVEMVIQHEGMRIIQVVVQYVSKYMDLGFKYYRKNKAKYITKTPKSTEITLIHKKKKCDETHLIELLLGNNQRRKQSLFSRAQTSCKGMSLFVFVL